MGWLPRLSHKTVYAVLVKKAWLEELVLSVTLPVEQGFEEVARFQRGSESRSLVILAFVLDQKGRWGKCSKPWPDDGLGQGVDLSTCGFYLQNLANAASLPSLQCLV